MTLRSSLHGLIAAGRGFLAAGSEEFGVSRAVIDSWLVGREEEKDNKRGGGSVWQLAGGKNPLLALIFGPFVTQFHFYIPNFPFSNFNDIFFPFFPPFLALKHGCLIHHGALQEAEFFH